MKKLRNSLVLVGIFFVFFLGLVSAQTAPSNCKFAWPQMGVVGCKEMGANAYNTYIWDTSKATLSDPYYIFSSLTCVSHCQITSAQDILSYLHCPNPGFLQHEAATISVTGGGNYYIQQGSQNNFPSPLSWERGQTVQITAWCASLSKMQLASAGVSWKENKIALYETTPDWPEHLIDGSDMCLMHALVQQRDSAQVTSGSVPSSWIDTEGNIKGSKTQYSTNVVDNLNRVQVTNMETGQTISYLYKWIDVLGINVAFDRQGNPTGYCGGSMGNRKFYSYSQVSTQDGSCYLIPTSVQKSVECCYPADCSFKGAGLTCDTSTYTCSDKKPCDSDLECQADTGTCVSKVLTNWKCDLSQPWYPKKGTCTKTTTSVECCVSEDCRDTSLYVCANNKCIVRQDLLNCPVGSCCKPGGKYIPQECSAGLQCCLQTGAIIGDCKQTCEPVNAVINENPNAGVVATNPKSRATPNNSLVWIVVGVVALVAVGGAVYYYMKKPRLHKIHKHKKEAASKTIICKKCGTKFDEELRFCTKCGNKLK